MVTKPKGTGDTGAFGLWEYEGALYQEKRIRQYYSS